MDGTAQAPAEAGEYDLTERRICLLVLGMHRSGTSALARMLNLLGAELPQHLVGSTEHNKTGHWEPALINATNEYLLTELGSSWDDWRPNDWETLPAHRRYFYKSEISRLIAEDYGDASLFVMKEPRICRLVPVYLDVLNELGIEIRIIFPFRNPLSVSASLEARDDIHPMIGQLLWLRHVLDAEVTTRDLKRTFLDYDDLLSDWRGNLERMQAELGLDLWQYAGKDRNVVEKEIDGFLNKGERHFRNTQKALQTSPAVTEWSTDTFRALRRLQAASEDSKAQGQLDELRADFDKSTSLFAFHFAALRKKNTDANEFAKKLEADLADQQAQSEQALSDAEQTLQERQAEINTLITEKANTLTQLQHSTAEISNQQELLRNAEATLGKTKERLQNTETSLGDTRNKLAETECTLFSTVEALHASEQAHKQAAQETSNLRVRLSGLEQQLAAARHTLETERDGLRKTIRAMQTSTSWKVTRPLRLIRQIPLRMRERRNARRIAESDLFDTQWYLQTYPDVSSSGLSPALHFLRYGAQEGRSPSPRFDTRWYLQTYTDVRTNGSNPLLHYLAFGQAENRLATPAQSTAPSATPAQSSPPMAQLPAYTPPETPGTLVRDAAVQALTDIKAGMVSRPGWGEADNCKLITFYLPQYHRVVENSEWWSPGFTEWTNVARGTPNFGDHYQPHIPRELGYYDLGNVETMREQADMARLYGVTGFCFYHYWFSGRRILERPVDQFLKSDIDMSFCLCWANENWTRTWDGDTRSVLLEQKYGEDDALAFIESILPALKDPRYIQVDGKPLLVVYRAKEIPDASAWFAMWRQYAQENDLSGLHISVVDFYDIETPMEVGADSMVEFPPHKFNGAGSNPDYPPAITNMEFAGSLVDYRKMMRQSLRRAKPDFQLFRGIIPSWDNTARRQDTPTIIVNSSPSLYGKWLKFLRRYTQAANTSPDRKLIFVNAWNEWGEGCHLEPDMKWGLSYLEETLRSAYEAGSAAEQADNDPAAAAAELDQVLVMVFDGDAPSEEETAPEPVPEPQR